MKSKTCILIVIFLLSTITVGLLICIFLGLDHKTADLPSTIIFYMLMAFICIIFALKGPLRIAKKTLPLEPTRVFNITGRGLLFIGMLMLVICASLVFSVFLFSYSTLIIAMSFVVWLLILLLLGMIPFYLSMPKESTLSQWVSVMRNIGATEMAYWTNDKREGLDVGNVINPVGLITLDLVTISLEELLHEQNITIIAFASYTCPQFRAHLKELRAIRHRFRHNSDIDFMLIYTAEAHPEDGWKLADNFSDDPRYNNRKQDFIFYQAKTIEEREQTALTFLKNTGFDWPLYLDNMKDQALKAYNTWPIRLYAIKNNTVIYCGDQGPFGFQPSQLFAVIKKNL